MVRKQEEVISDSEDTSAPVRGVTVRRPPVGKPLCVRPSREMLMAIARRIGLIPPRRVSYKLCGDLIKYSTVTC